MADRIALAEFLATVKPGSRGDDWTWDDESLDLWRHDQATMQRLTDDIAANGQQTPVTVGDDGRVWDGHHRVVALDALAEQWVLVRRWDDLPAAHQRPGVCASGGSSSTDRSRPMPDTHDDLVAVLRAHGNGGERPSRPATAQAADRLEELAAEVETLRASDDLTEVVRQLGEQLGCGTRATCPACGQWVAHGHAEDCAWTALVFLVEGPRHG